MDTEEILRTAIGIEQEGIDFYTGSARKIKDENGKATLLFLANEEKRHRAFFESFLRKHGKGDDRSVKLLMRPRLFPDSTEYGDATASDLDRQILEHARETEKRSIEFYSDSKKLADEKLREGLDVIIKEEGQHLEWIEYLLENIRSSGAWGDLHSHFSLDGG